MLFLVNGKRQLQVPEVNGKKILLRIINASSSSYFYLGFGNRNMEVVSADGQAVEPIRIKSILIGTAETYDVLVNVPRGKSVEFRATPQDVTGRTSLFLGEGQQELAPDVPKPNYYGHSGHEGHAADVRATSTVSNNPSRKESGGGDAGHGGHGTNPMPQPPVGDDGHGDHTGGGGGDQLSYEMLKSPVSTKLNEANPTVEYTLNLTGNMWRYVWSFNNKVLSEADVIPIKKGQNVRFKLVNKTMMHHPLHLHGHFFRLVNQNGDFSPLKHTLDVAPMETRVIEFYASEEKDWIFHCHNLYHMEAGMTRIVRYVEAMKEAKKNAMAHPMSSSEMSDKPGAKMPSQVMGGNKWFHAGEAFTSNQGTDVRYTARDQDKTLELRARYNYREKDLEVRGEASRNMSTHLDIYGGAQNSKNAKAVGAGVYYRLPLLFESRVGVNSKNGLDYTISKELPLKGGVALKAKYGREYGKKEYEYLVEYRTKKRSITIEGGKTERGWEAGLRIRK
ncbi:MAG: multicopper oxidase domain-containing protein, partial [Bdellovibrionales bacterium]|nr:multicopper oxidase domain-containing protein [Bdellovibrionales bacterium]